MTKVFWSRVFKRKRCNVDGRVLQVLENLPKSLNVNESGYDVHTETADGNVVVYRVEFKEPIKISGDAYVEFIRFLWKTYKDSRLAIIEGHKNDVVCNDCYDVKVYIDREEIGGSIYVRSLRFEVRT